MDKVYIVFQDNEDTHDILGVFSSWKAARASIPDNRFWTAEFVGAKKRYPWFAQTIREYLLSN